MTREQKLALIVGFALVLIVGVLVSDHLSEAQKQMGGEEAGLAESLEPRAPGFGRGVQGLAIASARGGRVIDDGPVIDAEYFNGPDEGAREEHRTLENRAANALNALAGGAERAMDLLKESQNGNLPAAQMDVFEMPTNRGVEARRAPERPVPVARSGGEERARPASVSRSYPVHEVKSGESLWSIAEKYYGDGSEYVRLGEFNKDRMGAKGVLRVGASILVPPVEVLRGGAAPVSVPAQSEVVSERRGSDERSRGDSGVRRYTVESGDTLSEISQKLLGTSKRWHEILELNGLEDPGSLRVGQTIKIPGVSVSSSSE